MESPCLTGQFLVAGQFLLNHACFSFKLIGFILLLLFAYLHPGGLFDASYLLMSSFFVGWRKGTKDQLEKSSYYQLVRVWICWTCWSLLVICLSYFDRSLLINGTVRLSTHHLVSVDNMNSFTCFLLASEWVLLVDTHKAYIVIF